MSSPDYIGSLRPFLFYLHFSHPEVSSLSHLTTQRSRFLTFHERTHPSLEHQRTKKEQRRTYLKPGKLEKPNVRYPGLAAYPVNNRDTRNLYFVFCPIGRQ
jgi:hypothetical protein